MNSRHSTKDYDLAKTFRVHCEKPHVNFFPI
jgi:hypothetical protein